MSYPKVGKSDNLKPSRFRCMKFKTQQHYVEKNSELPKLQSKLKKKLTAARNMVIDRNDRL